MYRECQRCGTQMYGPAYEFWQNNCRRCQADERREREHAEELAKAKERPVCSGPIIDCKSVADIENEELRGELADLRAKLEALADTYAASATAAERRLREVAAERDRLLVELNEVRKDADMDAEIIEQISSVFPNNAPHNFSETGVSLLDDVRDLMKRANVAETQSRIDRQLAETMEARALSDAVKIAELEAALAEERERFDWLETGPAIHVSLPYEEHKGDSGVFTVEMGHSRTTGKTLRAAIDAARKGGGE